MQNWRGRFIAPVFLLTLLSCPAFALAAESPIDTGDTAWVMASAALVMLMTPGLALFYGGMVRRKNVLSVLMQCFFVIGLVSVQWVLFGYSFAFGADSGSLFGSFSWLGLNGVGPDPNPDYAATIPHLAFAVFQLMFAIITAALITGSLAERMRFPAFVLFILLWTTFVYDPLAHWVWGVGGWLREIGAMDFAGGTVVHISSGVSGLIAALVLGRRKGYRSESMLPHHLPLTVLGAGLLWFGWFGFNPGSTMGVGDGSAIAHIAVTTNIAAAMAILSSTLVSWLLQKKPDLSMIINGALAGLVAITAPCAFVGVGSAAIIGLIAGVLVVFAVLMFDKLKIDDPVGALSVHLANGIWGTLAVGLFAVDKITGTATGNGLLFGGGFKLLGAQAIGVVAVGAFTFCAALLVWFLIKQALGLRVSREEEIAGLDLGEHGSKAYPDFQGFLTK